MLESKDFASFYQAAPGLTRPSQRREPRKRVLYRAHIVSVVEAGNVHITGISPKGITGTSDFELATQQRVALDFGVAGHRFVTIAKCENGRFSGQFENPWMRLHPSLVGFAQLGVERAGTEKDAAFRSIIAKLLLTGGQAVVAVRNLSSAGALIEASLPFVPGRQMLFSLTYGEPVLAEVRWVDRGRAGVQFLGAFDESEKV